MNGSSLSLLTPIPFKKPISRPIRTTSGRISMLGTPIVNRSPATTEEKAAIEPGERSISPAMIR